MLTWADIALLLILGLSGLLGLWRGLVSEIMALLVWIGATALALAYGEPVSRLFEGHVQTPTLRWLLGYLCLFLALLLAGSLLTWLLRMLVRSTGLSGTDRVLGLGFGLVRGAAVVCVLVLLLGFTPMPQEPGWRNARLLPGFERGAQWLRTWLPEVVARQSWLDPLRARLASTVPNSENIPPAAVLATPAPPSPDPAPDANAPAR